MYRGVTFAALRRGIDPADADIVARMVQDVKLVMSPDAVHVDGVDASIEIRGPQVSRAVSIVAAKSGRAACRARVCQYVSISVVAVTVKKKITHYHNIRE